MKKQVCTVACIILFLFFNVLPVSSAEIVVNEIIDMGTLGGYSEARDINELGQIVGWSWPASGATHAFLWSEADGIIDLGTLGGLWTIAFGINDLGQVVGFSETASGARHAVLWETRMLRARNVEISFETMLHINIKSGFFVFILRVRDSHSLKI